MKCLRLPDTMMAAVRSKNNRLCARTDPPGAWERVKGAPRSPEWHHRDPRGYVSAADICPFTSTRTQPAAPAPTTAPPTTARRVVRRATPATLTGVNGRPTLACALSTATERPSLGDHPTDARAPNARAAVASKACLTLIFLISISSTERATESHSYFHVIDPGQ